MKKIPRWCHRVGTGKLIALPLTSIIRIDISNGCGIVKEKPLRSDWLYLLYMLDVIVENHGGVLDNSNGGNQEASDLMDIILSHKSIRCRFSIDCELIRSSERHQQLIGIMKLVLDEMYVDNDFVLCGE